MFKNIFRFVYLESHIFFGLRIEGRVNDQTIDEKPEMIADLELNKNILINQK